MMTRRSLFGLLLAVPTAMVAKKREELPFGVWKIVDNDPITGTVTVEDFRMSLNRADYPPITLDVGSEAPRWLRSGKTYRAATIEDAIAGRWTS